jgi:hypothetical protein
MHVTPLTASSSLTHTTVDRYLHSSFHAINVRMKQIPFTIKYSVKENRTLKHITQLSVILHVSELHSAVTRVTRMLTNTNNLSSQAHINYTVLTTIQASVHHIVQQVIQHILFVSFIQLQYVLPLSSTNKLPALYFHYTT